MGQNLVLNVGYFPDMCCCGTVGNFCCRRVTSKLNGIGVNDRQAIARLVGIGLTTRSAVGNLILNLFEFCFGSKPSGRTNNCIGR